MHEHSSETEDSDRGEKSSYDDFEERMRRIGAVVIQTWRKLSPHERTGHLISVATLAVLIFYTGYTIKIYKASDTSARAAESAALTAKQALVTGQRPWLGPKANPTFTFDQAGNPKTIMLAMKNFGLSPALHIGVGPNIEVFPDKAFRSLDEITKASENTCQWAEMASAKFPGIPTGIALFPNADSTIFGTWSNTVAPEDTFMILGCVTYYDQFPDTPLHHTAFCFRTYRPLKEMARPGIDWNKYLFQCNVATQVD